MKNKLMRFVVQVSALILVLCFSVAGVRAQDVPQAPLTGTQQWQIGVGYSSVSGPTSNGQLYTIAKQIDNRVWLAAKGFTLANPAGVVVAVGALRYRVPFSAVRRANDFLDTSKWFVSADLNLGATKDAAQTARFAYGVGAGLDYQASETVTLMILQADYIRSKVFPGGGVLVHNINSLTTGLKFTF